MVAFDPVKFMGFVAGTSLAASLVLLTGPAGSAEISHAYSKLDEASCMTLVVNEEEGWSQQVCKGHDGIAVFVSEGDLRMSLSYRNQAADDRFFTFGNFNRVGDTMEWRLRDEEGRKVPFATILRWYVSVEQPREEQALVITKIEENDFCIAGFVEATAERNANFLARDVADQVVPGFGCGQDQPQWHGQTGPLASAMTR